MQRIRNLIDQVGIGSSGQRPKHEAMLAHVVEQSIVLPTRVLSNPTFEAEAMRSIDDAYYKGDTDGNVFDVQKLPSNPSQQLIHEMCEKLHIQLSAVSKRLSDVILENQQSYQKELQRVRDLQKTLQTAFTLCHTGKNCLLSTTSIVHIRLLVHVKHRENLMSLYAALCTIKTLEHTDVRLRELMEEESYPEAIQLCLECQKVSVAFRQYNCIKDLSSKLQDTIEQIEEQIDVALSYMCNNFNHTVYEKLQTSYKLLCKRQTAVDQLLMHFTTCIHNTSFQALMGFVQLCSKEPDANLQKKQYNDLCSSIDSSMYIPCLLAICKALWQIMHCYHKVSLWHSQESLETDSKTSEVELNQQYVLHKLEHGRHRIWSDVQSKVKNLLMGIDLSNFKYDEFIKVIGIVTKFICIGVTFSKGSENEFSAEEKLETALNEPIYQQSLRYFRNYHKKSLDELHMFLDNEAWQACPIQANFSVLHLPEFKFLQEENYKSIINSNKTVNSHDDFFDCEETDQHPFVEFENQPDGPQVDSTKLGDSYFDNGGDDDDEFDDEFLQDFVEDIDYDAHVSKKKKTKPRGPILTNTALNVLRICGKYLRMCDVLKPIAADVIICMSHLFDYYLMSVYELFARQDTGFPLFSKKLLATLDRIKSQLIRNPFENETSGLGPKVPLPLLSPLVDLHLKATMFGLPHRIIATESLMNLANEFERLHPDLKKVIPSNQGAFLQQFYAQTISTCSEIRSLSYFSVSAGLMDYESILRKMSEVKWDVRDIMSQHSHYVDELLHQFKLLKAGFLSMADDMPFPSEIEKIIWHHCIVLSGRTFVEGYSNVNKCSNEGRALMQLDFQQFVLKSEELTGVRPAPGKEFVEAYIKAFYLNAEDLEIWMKNHTEYSEKQLTALTSCSASSTVGSATKKNKQRMRAMIDDLTRRR